jgi:pilus assembly protein CpaB
MRLNTLVTLGGATVFGLVAVWLARGWIDTAIETEFEKARPAKMLIERPKNTVPVVVATLDIAFGQALTVKMLDIVEVPESARPFGAYDDLDTLLADRALPNVALTQIAANEIILDHRVSGPGGRGSLSALITPGMRAASIRVSTVSGVGGFIVPGDHVDVLYIRDEETRRNGINLKSDLLLQNVKVLGIDQNLNDQSDSALPADTVTLEVLVDDAQKLRLAQDAGQLSLSLRRRGETDLVEAGTIYANAITRSDVMPTQRAVSQKQHRARTSRPRPRPSGAEVTVIRGDEREPVMVFRDIGGSGALAQLAGDSP